MNSSVCFGQDAKEYTNVSSSAPQDSRYTSTTESRKNDVQVTGWQFSDKSV
jgi:hypothetical protein